MKLVILISGSGSNMVSIAQAIHAKKLNAKIACVISDQPQAPGLKKAQDLGIKTQIIEQACKLDRNNLGEAIKNLVSTHAPDFIVLAGFMRIIDGSFITDYEGRILNIHPSLLPDFKGLNTHRRVLTANETHHGSSVHFVNQSLDGGPVIAQLKLEVNQLLSGTPAQSLDQKVHWLEERIKQQEHRLYPLCLSWLQTGKIRYENQNVRPEPKIVLNEESLNRHWKDF